MLKDYGLHSVKETQNDLQEKVDALVNAYAYKVPEPILSNKELSDVVGELTRKCEALRADLVALENRYVELDSKPRDPLHVRVLQVTANKIFSYLLNRQTKAVAQ